MKLLFTAPIATAAILFAGAGFAHADELTDTCARALPAFQAQCYAQDTTTPTGPGVGPARGTAPTKYFNGLGPSVVYGYDKDKPLTNDDGTPKLDAQGNQLYEPIMGGGEPTYGTKPGTDGPLFEGYQYK